MYRAIIPAGTMCASSGAEQTRANTSALGVTPVGHFITEFLFFVWIGAASATLAPAAHTGEESTVARMTNALLALVCASPCKTVL